MIEVQGPPPGDGAEPHKTFEGGPEGTPDLAAGTAHDVLAAMFEGAAPPAQSGKMQLANSFSGETAAELTGLLTALAGHVAHLELPPDRPPPVLLPTYSGTRRLPNLTALLALLLNRYRVPVLLHGTVDDAKDFRRVSTIAVLQELGIEPACSIKRAERQLAADGIAYVPVVLLSPPLARLLSLQSRSGSRSTAHTLAKLVDPFGGAGFRVVGVTHPEELPRNRGVLAATRANALLLHGTEGEPFANPRRQPQLEWFERGVGTVLFDAEADSPTALPPAVDARSTAEWIAAALAGKVSIPQPLLNQLACCIHGTHTLHAAVQKA